MMVNSANVKMVEHVILLKLRHPKLEPPSPNVVAAAFVSRIFSIHFFNTTFPLVLNF